MSANGNGYPPAWQGGFDGEPGQWSADRNPQQPEGLPQQGGSPFDGAPGVPGPWGGQQPYEGMRGMPGHPAETPYGDAPNPFQPERSRRRGRAWAWAVAALVAVGAVVAARQGSDLKDDPVYRERLDKGLVRPSAAVTDDYRPTRSAVPSLLIFLAALVLVVAYATVTSQEVGIISNPPMSSTLAIMTIMLTTAAVICLVARKPTASIASQDTFRAGMTATICVMGLAWLGNAFVEHYEGAISVALSGPLQALPWLAAVFFYFAAPLMFSHAATTKAFMPLMVSLGLPAVALLASYPAVANYYLLPNYPTTVAAMEMDDTGSTRVGGNVFAHPFVLPGTVSIVICVILGFLLAPLVV